MIWYENVYSSKKTVTDRKKEDIYKWKHHSQKKPQNDLKVYIIHCKCKSEQTVNREWSDNFQRTKGQRCYYLQWRPASSTPFYDDWLTHDRMIRDYWRLAIQRLQCTWTEQLIPHQEPFEECRLTNTYTPITSHIITTLTNLSQLVCTMNDHDFGAAAVSATNNNAHDQSSDNKCFHTLHRLHGTVWHCHFNNYLTLHLLSR